MELQPDQMQAVPQNKPRTIALKGDRGYQIASIESLREGFRNRHKRQVLAAPTGAGKSVIMLDMIACALEKGTRMMFVCERRILVEQFSRHLDGAGIDHGILMANHWRFRPQAAVQIASAQTLERMESIPAVDVIFIDELHACLRASIINLLETQPNLRVIGATATPFHPAIAKHFTNVVSVTTMEQLVAEKYLVPFRVFVAKEIDTVGVPVVAGEWKKDVLEARGQQIVGDVVSDYIRISNDVFGSYRKTICFSCGIAHGAELARKFQEAGINAVQIASGDDEWRDEVLKDFARPDTTIQIVISVSILSRGFDQTDIEHVILARPLKKSFSEHVQMVGRGARSHPGKNLCVIQDNAGNWLRFADDWERLYQDGVQELTATGPDSKPKKEPSDEFKEAAKCPKCSALWGGGDICSNCGHVRVRRNDVIAVAGEMVELNAAAKREKFTAEYKAQFYAELLGYVQEKNRNPGWAYYLYIDKFGVGPSMQKPKPQPPSVETERWLISNMARNKARKKAMA